jgi:hypothetical protein
MAHVFEPAPTGRAKCRGCGEAIAAGAVRFGERVPNPFAEGDTTHWFHPECAAYKRPEPLLQGLQEAAEAPPDADRLRAAAELGLAHARLPRLNGAERAASGRAECRHCKTPIDKGAWRFSLVYYEDGRFSPSGFIHPACAAPYFETADGLLERARRFSPKLTEDDVAALRAELAAPPPPAA